MQVQFEKRQRFRKILVRMNEFNSVRRFPPEDRKADNEGASPGCAGEIKAPSIKGTSLSGQRTRDIGKDEICGGHSPKGADLEGKRIREKGGPVS